MALLFSYGTLQKEEVQIATLGRRLEGGRDELVGFERSSVPIADPGMSARLGMTHHANLAPAPGARVAGMAFTVTEAELARIDGYEAEFDYRRIRASLASGRETWVYVYAPEDGTG